MATGNGALEEAKSHARSRVSNHRDILPNIDGRSVVARRYRDILAAIIVDQGGLDRMAEARVQVARRFAACCVLAEELEARLANRQQIDIAQHATLTSTMVRVAQRIGINRTAKNITPDLNTYIRTKHSDEVGDADYDEEADA